MRSWVLLSPIAAATLLAAAPSARADDVAFLRGGPREAAARVATLHAIAEARADMIPCWRRGTSAVEVAVSTDRSGRVRSAAARTDGPVAQCVAGLLAVATMPESAGAWSGVITVAPSLGGGGGGGGGDDVGRALQQHLAALQTCQSAAPGAAGVAEIAMRVHRGGAISDVTVARSLAPALDACLVRALSKLRLAGYTGNEVRYKLGLQFGGGGSGGGAARPPAHGGQAGPAPSRRGPLGSDQMLPVIEAARADIDRCKLGVHKNGTLMIRFTVRKDGSVKNLAVKQGIGAHRAEQCILDRFGKMQFPAAGAETQVQFPLVFGK